MSSVLNQLRNKLKREETCESCGASFTCGALSGSCWCMEQPLSDKARTELKESYKGCLCPDCLRAANESGSVSSAGKIP